MKALQPRIFLAITCCLGLLVACSKDNDDSPENINGSGGAVNGNGSGGTQGGVLDRDELAENCQGLTVEDAASCSQAELVCSTNSGVLCICGGVPPETGQVNGEDGGDDDDDWWRPRSGSGGRSGDSSDGDLAWVCFSIGPPPQEGEGGQGGDTGDDDETGGTNQGGEGGAF